MSFEVKYFFAWLYEKRMNRKSLYFLVLFALCLHTGFGQVPQGPIHRLTHLVPDREVLASEDAAWEKMGKLPRSGVVVPADRWLTTASGQWTEQTDGSRTLHYIIEIPTALALNAYFQELYLPPGATLTISGVDDSTLQVLTASGLQAAPRMATDLVKGDQLIFRYQEPATVKGLGRIRLREIGFFYRNISPVLPRKNFGNAGNCQVNIACQEGDGWRELARAVVRILVRNGNALGWCTGSLINNVRQDFTPYLLTAMHCGLNDFTGRLIPQSDIDQWIFFFNYQAPNCQSPLSDAGLNGQSIVGAQVVAHSDDEGGETGSDFLLLRFNNQVPASFNPVFIGWDRRDLVSNSGVLIHHPQGDLKKISTYTQPTVTTQFTSRAQNTHWEVRWTATANGHGVTEGGSSGGALLSSTGRVLGVLTGGFASCAIANRIRQDFFGKFSYSWQSNGTAANRRLSPWLDPDQTGALTLGPAAYANEVVLGPGETALPEMPQPVLYPNPVASQLNLSLPTGQGEVSVKVADLSGKTLLYQNLGQATDWQTDVSAWPQGLFLVEVAVFNGPKPRVFKLKFLKE